MLERLMIGKILKNIKIQMDMQQVNVFGDPIEECCSNPITGFYRDGFCHTDQLDRGLHVSLRFDDR